MVTKERALAGHAASDGSSQRRLLFTAWVIAASLLLALLPPRVDAGKSGAHPETHQGKPVAIARVRYIKRGPSFTVAVTDRNKQVASQTYNGVGYCPPFAYRLK